MATLTTTYRHDYLSPNLDRYNISKMEATESKSGDCKCELKDEVPNISNLGESCRGGGEWTGVAPMGILLKPRNISVTYDDEQANGKSCFSEKPNKFLEKLCIKYPELYERLKQTPHDDLYRKIDTDRFKSTYQIDFCNLSEYPEGVYDGLQSKNNLPQGAGSSGTSDPCAIYRANKTKSLPNIDEDSDNPCIGLYRPVRVDVITRIPKSYVSSSHWGEKLIIKGPRISEYKDVISRIGGIIQKENLHDHSKCSEGKNCSHRYL